MRDAVILSAGKGSRLGYRDTPKCLTEIAGGTILDHQIRSLRAAGVDTVTIVTGFGAEQVDAVAARWRGEGADVTTLFNPFFALADNIVSVWAARTPLRGGSLLINGDTMFEPQIVAEVIGTRHRPIAIATDRKDAYDEDDMKMQIVGGQVRAIGKRLDLSIVNGEAIGMIGLFPEGAPLLIDRIDRLLRDPENLRAYYLSAVSALAAEGHVWPVAIEGLDWCEVDFPEDLPVAERLLQGPMGKVEDRARWNRVAG